MKINGLEMIFPAVAHLHKSDTHSNNRCKQYGKGIWTLVKYLMLIEQERISISRIFYATFKRTVREIIFLP